jgi:selenide,water dikinase
MLALLEETLRGSGEVAREAGAFILGGHSIDDEEPKFGLVAIGEAQAADIITIGGARPGDHLVLTKPIGTGILSTALKRDLISETEMASAIGIMRTLNAGALHAVRSVETAVHAVTDVTGFGLIGHLWNMLSESRVSARLFADSVPLLDLAAKLAAAGAVPGGSERNREAAAEWTDWHDEVGETERILLCDAQTSGGLLIAVESGATDRLVAALHRNDTPAAAVIGEVVAGEPPRIGVAVRGEQA